MSTVCRVCLTGGGNVMLCSLEDVRLKDVYKKLTNTQFYSEDGRSRAVCSFCYRYLLRCWNLSEMARRSENIFSNLLFKGLEATYETIEDLNLGTKLHLSVAPMQFIDLDNETPKKSSAKIIKEEPVQVDELVDTESADTYISEECIKSQLIFEDDSNNDNYLTDNSTEMDIVQLDPETDTEKLDSDQEQSQNQKVKIHPDKSKTFCCDICSKTFLVRSRLVSHIQLSHAMEQQCKTIDKKLNDFHFKRPEKVGTGDKPYACSICHKQYKHKSNLVTHMRIHTGLKLYTCSICDKQCITKSNLVTHMRIHTGVKPYACSICDKQFNQKPHLVRHMRIHTGVKPYACSICDKHSNQKSDLAKHMRIHTGVKPYPCSVCDKQFNQKSNLVKHMRIHTGVKPCSICDKQFSQKSHLVRHMRIHTGVKPYPCSICDKQFNKKSHLVRHMRIHTGVKPYPCGICHKQFNQKSNLITHMRIHTGVKPYPCSICDKQFNQKSNLVKHMRIHTGVKPYPCGICDKQFNQKSTLVTHMRIHTGEKPRKASTILRPQRGRDGGCELSNT